MPRAYPAGTASRVVPVRAHLARSETRGGAPRQPAQGSCTVTAQDDGQAALQQGQTALPAPPGPMAAAACRPAGGTQRSDQKNSHFSRGVIRGKRRTIVSSWTWQLSETQGLGMKWPSQA